MYEEALAFATERHEGQTRLDGSPYIAHPIAVANKFTDDLRKTVSVLHDVVEDKKATLAEVRERFGDRVAKAVDSVSRRPGETYKDFIRRAARDPIGKDIKISDIEHNMIDSGNSAASDKAKSLRKRYIPALLYLTGESKEY